MSFGGDTNVKAVRKANRCDGCGARIEVGQPATRWVGLADGDFCTAIYHPDCRKAEVSMNQDILGHQYGDWWPLSEIDSDDRPWLIETYPEVAARMGITAKVSP